jgi:hypothetical protein
MTGPANRRDDPMSRMVYVKARVRTLVPVVCEIALIVRADDDASIEKAVKAHLRGKRYGRADVEQDPGEGLEIMEINNAEPPADDYTEPSEHLPNAVQELIDAGKSRLVSLEVTDSK